MRIAHLADLHLGRVFHGSSLIDDQREALRWITTKLQTLNVDVLLLAGDLYDRALPGRDAVRLLDDFLRDVNEELEIPVIAIAGNHDSAEHLGFGAWLFARGDVHVRGRIDRESAPITLEDSHGEVTFYPLPYIEPEVVRAFIETDTDGPLSHRDAMGFVLDQARHHAKTHGVKRSVVIAHGFVIGAAPPEESRRSERNLYLGGAGAIPVAAFDGFDYVALGHLHRPQSLTPRARYAGSLLKYSFDEVTHDKGFTLIDLGPEGALSVEHVSVPARRDLATLSGTLDSLLTDVSFAFAESCFVSVSLEDPRPPLQAAERLRKRFTHLAEVHFAQRATPTVEINLRAAPNDPEEVFAAFATKTRGAGPDNDELELFREAVNAESQREIR